jgi:hypothetical protein
MVRVFNSATGRFEECSVCEQKRLARQEMLAKQQGAANRQSAIQNMTFQPQRVPRTVYAASSYPAGSITGSVGRFR